MTFMSLFQPRFVALILVSLLLVSCGGDDEPLYVERPVEDLYNEGFDRLIQNDYNLSADLFNEVERQHPYSSWAPRAQLMAAYAFYIDDQYIDAITTLDRFIQLNPGHKDIAYAYYLRAISYYEQISDVRRDQSMTRLALESLQELERKFPQSSYAKDARLKIDLTVDHLAGKHMEVGRYYLDRGDYLAAINRFRIVVREYQTTTHIPEALHRLVECYLALGIYREAQSTAAVLGHNYPGSDWYADTYYLLTNEDLRPEQHEGSWISDFFSGII